MLFTLKAMRAGSFTRTCWRCVSDSWTTSRLAGKSSLAAAFMGPQTFREGYGSAVPRLEKNQGDDDGGEHVDGCEQHDARRPDVEPRMEAVQIPAQRGLLARPRLAVRKKGHLDLDERTDDLVVVHERREQRLDAMPGGQQREA